MAASLLAAGIGAAASLYGSSKASKAAKDAAAAQRQGIQQGISSSQPYYDQGQNYLKPYVDAGSKSLGLTQDIIGFNGTEGQNNALSMYQSSPSANLLKQVQEEALRQTAGKWSANGSYRSGSMIDDLSRRQSDIALSDYNNWQNLNSGLMNTGANAAGNAANLASGRGNQIIGAYSGIGDANASGIVGSANAQIGGIGNATNYLTNFLGKQSQSNDFSDFFKTTQPGNASNGGWSTTTTPTAYGLPNYLSTFMH